MIMLVTALSQCVASLKALTHAMSELNLLQSSELGLFIPMRKHHHNQGNGHMHNKD